MGPEPQAKLVKILGTLYHPREVVSHYSFSGPPLPSMSGDYEPCPELLTEEQAIRFLRIDQTSTKNPSNTLRYYREKGRLKATRIGNKLFYSRTALIEFIHQQTGTLD